MQNFFGTVTHVAVSLAMTMGIVAFANPAHAAIAQIFRRDAVRIGDRYPEAQVKRAAELRTHAPAERVSGFGNGGPLAAMHAGPAPQPRISSR